MRNFSKSMLIALFTLALIWACSDEANQVTNEIALSKSGIEPVPSGGTANSDQGITPYVLTIDGIPIGDPDCLDVAEAFGFSEEFEFSSGKLNYNSETGTFDGDWPEGLTVTVTPEYWNNNLGTYVEWSFTPPAGYCNLLNMAVIVRGCDEANVYFYPNGDITTDSGLASPIGTGSVPCVLENLTFCYNLEPCEEEKCYGGSETAFGGNNEGGGKAWWFYYDVETGGEQTIWAGQHMDAGSVEYVGGQIMINLDGWGLEDDSEAVKIQGYDTPPSKRQPAGKFTTYKGMSLNPEVESFDYYVIHLDVLQEVECEEE